MRIPVLHKNGFRKACLNQDMVYIPSAAEDLAPRKYAKIGGREECDILDEEIGRNSSHGRNLAGARSKNKVLAANVGRVVAHLQRKNAESKNLCLRCLVFVKTIADAYVVRGLLLQQMPEPGCECVLGHSEMKSWETQQKLALERFHKGSCQLLVCTSVLEEGIDVCACNVVVRLDCQLSLRSYIQSRGRARAHARGTQSTFSCARKKSGAMCSKKRSSKMI